MPFFLVFLYLNYADGTLSPAWALWIFTVSGIMGIVGAIFVWYIITLPLIKRQKRKL